MEGRKLNPQSRQFCNLFFYSSSPEKKNLQKGDFLFKKKNTFNSRDQY